MSDLSITNNKLIVPIGTQIVTRGDITSDDESPACPIGSVGVVIDVPADNSREYGIRLTDGTIVQLNRSRFSIRKHYQQDALGRVDSKFEDYIIYKCIVGSRAFGLDDRESDTDWRGIYLPPAETQWSIQGVPKQIENKENEECYWELQKFLILALKANPNILECLYTPLVEMVTPLAEQLLAMRTIFLSQLVYQTYNGYVMSQFKKLEQDLRNTGTIRWKHAMHLIRLLSSGVTALREGYVPVRVESGREELLAIRRGEMPWEEVDQWRLRLHKEFDAALAITKLPIRPDVEKANAFLIQARRSMVRD